MHEKSLGAIPRGDTCQGVNRAIIEYLLSETPHETDASFLDVPCGSGEFLAAVRELFPSSKTTGADIRRPSGVFPHQFLQADMAGEIPIDANEKFDVVTCISGVMEFDNTLNFFARLRRSIDEKGVLFVTNDNLLTARDRVLYLLFGRVGHYRLFIGSKEPSWKTLSLHNLLRILHDARFEASEIRYVPVRNANWLWLPIALPLYAFQYLYMRFGEPNLPLTEKTSRYPFLSILSRHYVIVCKPRN
jgi:SAM-dependent methyltransferase